MTDIVERLNLRYRQSWSEVEDTLLMKEAADEIERLLKVSESLRMEIIALLHIADRDEIEIERLRKLMSDVLSHVPHGAVPSTIYDQAVAASEGK